MFEKVKTTKVYMEIVKQIQNLVNEGRLKPGDKLPPEHLLADKLGVSRPPLREALCALEILGITESRGGKGNFIKGSFDSISYARQFKELEQDQSPFELLETRKVIEVEIAGLAAEKATKEDVDAIQKSLDNTESAIRQKREISEIMEIDMEFDMNMTKAIHNTILSSIMAYVAEGSKEKLWVHLKGKCWSIPGRPQRYFEEHEKILDAIKKKDGKRARERMYNHLVGIERDLINE